MVGGRMNAFNPFKFDGRIGRLQYFGFGVVWVLIFFAFALVIGLGGEASNGVLPGSGLASLGLWIVFEVATVSYGIRRLHDFDKSGWWYLLTFVPVANFVLAVVLLLAPGSPGANSYGTRD